VKIRTASPVARILVDGDRVTGIELEGGEQLAADTIVSNADPRTTFFKLVGARHLDAGFVRKIQHIRMRGSAAKLHLALKSLPEFTGLQSEQLAERLVIAPDPAYVERAFDHAKYGEFSTSPALEICLPSVSDPGLAPDGQHVLSAIVQYAPYELKGGWDAGREAFKEVVLTQLARYAPGIREQIVHAELLTPVDIEREFRITGGHWHHGELALDQALMLRPVPAAAQYATPLTGLYLCGAGSNAANAVLRGE
jgi:phytoene dehydrogenase-like protein